MAEDRAETLEKENAQLRSRLATLEERALVRREERTRRGRIASLMFFGGVAAGLSGVFMGSILVIGCGLGWMFGGAAIGSTISADD